MVKAIDEILISRVRDGDRDAYGELWERHQTAGLAAARNIAPSLDPEELTAEAFARILDLLDSGNGPDYAFRPYLYQVIRNLAVNEYRVGRREAPLGDDFEEVPEPDEYDLAHEYNLRLAREAFAALPIRWQEVLWYTEVEGMPPREVAELIGGNAASVAQLSMRARRGLRKEWIAVHAKSGQLALPCQRVVSQLPKYFAGQLPTRQRLALEAHVAECEICQELMQEGELLFTGTGSFLATAFLGSTTAGSLALSGTIGKGIAAVGAAAGAGALGGLGLKGALIPGSLLAGIVLLGTMGGLNLLSERESEAAADTTRTTAPETAPTSEPVASPALSPLPAENETPLTDEPSAEAEEVTPPSPAAPPVDPIPEPEAPEPPAAPEPAPTPPDPPQPTWTEVPVPQPTEVPEPTPPVEEPNPVDPPDPVGPPEYDDSLPQNLPVPTVTVSEVEHRISLGGRDAQPGATIRILATSQPTETGPAEGVLVETRATDTGYWVHHNLGGIAPLNVTVAVQQIADGEASPWVTVLQGKTIPMDVSPLPRDFTTVYGWYVRGWPGAHWAVRPLGESWPISTGQFAADGSAVVALPSSAASGDQFEIGYWVTGRFEPHPELLQVP